MDHFRKDFLGLLGLLASLGEVWFVTSILIVRLLGYLGIERNPRRETHRQTHEETQSEKHRGQRGAHREKREKQR